MTLRHIALASLLLAAPVQASEVFVPYGQGRYQRVEIPNARGDRLRVDAVPGTDRSVLYDRSGRRVGELRVQPWDRSVVVYDNQGRRLSR
jgi:hypothetical protein